jgi:toxin ParE1/3/4
VAWYLERSQLAAARFVIEVDRALELIVSSPDRWPSGAYATQKFVLRRFPFVVVYRDKETVVQVLAIAHGRRRPGYWKTRL